MNWQISLENQEAAADKCAMTFILCEAHMWIFPPLFFLLLQNQVKYANLFKQCTDAAETFKMGKAL